jgi:hypothetical protein
MPVAVEQFCATELIDVESVDAALKHSHYWAVRQLACQRVAGRIIVRGSVPTYYLKQIAESLVAKTVGSARVSCDIAVRDE